MQSLFLFGRRDSFLHRLDPRSKFVTALAILVYILSFNRLEYMIPPFIAVILLLWFFGNISPREYWPVLALLVPLVGALMLIQGLTRGGSNSEVALAIGSLVFTTEGLLFGLSIGMRLATMGITFTTFAMTTTPKDIGLALHRTGIPFKYAYLGTFGLSFLPLMKGNLDTLQDARAVRGDPDVGSRNVFRRLKSLPKSLFPLMANAMRQSTETAKALELRGYGREGERTVAYDINLAYADYVILVFAVIFVAVTLYTRYVLQIGFYPQF